MIGWLLSPLGRVLGIAAVASAAWFGVIRHYEKKGELKVVQRSIKAGEAANEKNDAVRAAAKKPGAFERLMRDSCRDC